MNLRLQAFGFARRCVASAIAVLTGAAAYIVIPSGPANAALGPVTDEALATDAAAYAEEFGVSQAEALRRLELQSAIGDLDAVLAKAERATFGGLSIEHEPEFGVVVRFARGKAVNLAKYVHNDELADRIKVVEVETSLARLQAAGVEAAAVTRDAEVPAAVMVDVHTNRVVVEVAQSPGLEVAQSPSLVAGQQAWRLSLPPEATVVEVPALDTPQASLFGGFRINDPSGDLCTAGFAVVNQYGTKGISTAGHCKNTQYRSGVLLPFIHERHGGSYDVQWHTAPGFTILPRVADNNENDSTPGYRVVTGTRSRANQSIGAWVCMFGTVTGYSCATIDKKDYKPEDHPSATSPYTNTYVRVKKSPGAGCISAHGDSGAPWFSGGIAYGILGGGKCNRDENYAYYMAINYLTALNPGVTVLLG